MKYLLIVLVFPFLSASECGKKKKEETPVMEEEKAGPVTAGQMPMCLQKMIDSLQKEPADTPLKVDAYLYNGKTVYLMTAPCCDQFNTLYDENCGIICVPSGGFTGKGDGKCPDFSKTATHIKVVWTMPADK